jgi:putative iron-dependent peroxidase
VVTQQVVAPAARSSIFLTLTVREGSEAAVLEFLTDLPGLTRSVGFREPEVALNAMVGIGADLWDRMLTAPRPRHLHPFKEFRGAVHHAPATPGDLLIHLRGMRPDVPFELMRLILDALDGAVDIADEVHAFRYFDNRDLLGFVDGTENPEGQDAWDAVLIGEEEPTYAGGSYVVVQKYIHDLAQWQQLSTEEQERVIGRTKLDDVELPDDELPSNSHVALNDISDEDGNGLDIMRFNMAFGDFTKNELGTYFIGYAADVTIIEQMLENMFIGDPVGNHDRILDFSTALTGNTFFSPSLALLESLDDLGRDD